MKYFTFPKTKFEDYLKYREMVVVNLNHFKKIEMPEEKIKENINFIYNRFFKNKIYQSDLYPFDSLKGLEDFLFSTGYFSSELINDCVNHEEEHIRKIHELGYSVKDFSVWLLNYKGKVTFSARVSANLEGISHEKLKEIYNAPENLSLTDEYFI